MDLLNGSVSKLRLPCEIILAQLLLVSVCLSMRAQTTDLDRALPVKVALYENIDAEAEQAKQAPVENPPNPFNEGLSEINNDDFVELVSKTSPIDISQLKHPDREYAAPAFRFLSATL